MSARKRRILVFTVVAALAVVIALGFAMRERIGLAWNLSRLESGDAELQETALVELRRFRTPKTVDAIARFLSSTRSPRLVEISIESLWLLGDEGRERLAPALLPHDTATRMSALSQLLALDAPWKQLALTADALTDSRECEDQIIEWLTRSIDTPKLLELAGDTTRGDPMRRAALRALDWHGLMRSQALIDRSAVQRVAASIATNPTEEIDLRGHAHDVADLFDDSPRPSPSVFLAPRRVRAKAGEEFTLIVRTDYPRPISLFSLQLDALDPIESVELVTDSCRASAWTDSGVFARRHPKRPVFVVGFLEMRSEDPVLLEVSGEALFRLKLRVRGDATSGRHEISVREASVGTLGRRPPGLLSGAKVEIDIEERPAASLKRAPADPGDDVPTGPKLDLAFEPLLGEVRLRWMLEGVETRGPIGIFRNGERIATVEAGTNEYVDRYRSVLFTVYELRDGATVLVRRVANEFASPYRFHTELVSAKPGQKDVTVRLFATHAEPCQGLSFGIKIDPNLARITRLTNAGCASEAVGFGSFLYQKHRLEYGETACGMLDMAPPLAFLEAGAEQHVATIVLDVAESCPRGTEIPIIFGAFGTPPASNTFTIDEGGAVSRDAATLISGAVLVGDSPIATVRGLRARQVVEARGGIPEVKGVELRWEPFRETRLIELERNGTKIATLRGDTRSYFDGDAAAGRHIYRVRARGSQKTSFPVETEVELGRFETDTQRNSTR